MKKPTSPVATRIQRISVDLDFIGALAFLCVSVIWVLFGLL
jgi:hypothetical protein